MTEGDQSAVLTAREVELIEWALEDYWYQGCSEQTQKAIDAIVIKLKNYSTADIAPAKAIS